MSDSIQDVIINCHRLGSLEPTALEAGQYKIKAFIDSVSGENPLPGSQVAVFSVSSLGGRHVGLSMRFLF